jgi:hypothetical protein
MVVVAVVAAAAIGISSLGSTPSASAAPISCEDAVKLAAAASAHARLFEIYGHPGYQFEWIRRGNWYINTYCGKEPHPSGAGWWPI